MKPAAGSQRHSRPGQRRGRTRRYGASEQVLDYDAGSVTDRAEGGMVPSAAPRAIALSVDATTHRMAMLRALESPHADERPSPTDISLLVVHAISLPPGEVGEARNRGYI